MVGLGKLLWQDTTIEERWRGKTDSALCQRSNLDVSTALLKSWDVRSCHSPGMELAQLGSVSLSLCNHQKQHA